nr:MAG TPA: hypothetical protein [Caudoviricetes sp.]
MYVLLIFLIAHKQNNVHHLHSIHKISQKSLKKFYTNKGVCPESYDLTGLLSIHLKI